MNIEIANRLVQLRREQGLSQEELASKLGVSRQAVSKWERAESSPDTDNLIALARLYGVSLDELLLHMPGSGGAAAAAAAAQEPEPEYGYEPYAQSEAAEVFAAAQEWEMAEEAVAKSRRKAFKKNKEKLLWLLTLAMMVILPLACSLFGVGEIYPVIVVIAYLASGFLLDNWHPGWLIFLSVPIYEYMLGIF